MRWNDLCPLSAAVVCAGVTIPIPSSFAPSSRYLNVTVLPTVGLPVVYTVQASVAGTFVDDDNNTVPVASADAVLCYFAVAGMGSAHIIKGCFYVQCLFCAHFTYFKF